MKTIPDDHYTYRVTWSEEDQEYVGLCAEFPQLEPSRIGKNWRMGE